MILLELSPRGVRHAFHGQAERRLAEADPVRAVALPDCIECTRHHGRQPPAYTCQAPALALPVLRPFEVTDDHTAGISQNVGDYDDPPIPEDLVRLSRDRAVGPFHDHPR